MNFRDLIWVSITLFLWSSNVIVQKILVTELPLLTVNLCRFTLLLPLILFVKRPQGPLWPYAVTALFWNVLNFVFQGLGWKMGVEASISAFVIQTNVFFSLLFSFLMLKRRPRSHQLLGMFVTSCGILYLVLSKESAPLSWTFGLTYLFCSAIFSGLGFTFLQRFHFKGSIQDMSWLCFFSFLILLPFTFLIEGDKNFLSQLTQISLRQWGGIAYGSIMSTFIAGIIWLGLVIRHSPGALMPFLLLLPATTTILSSVLLKEKMNIFQGLSCCIMMTGVLISQSPALKSLIETIKKSFKPL